MNSVFISGIVKGEPKVVKNEGITRVVVVQDKQNSKEFTVFAPKGDNADKLESIDSGKRLILDGRISGEELVADSGIYQGVISTRRILAVTEAMNGIDAAHGTVGGLATCDALRFTGTGTAIANLNIKNTRTITKRDGEQSSITTYLNAVAWKDKAQQLEPLIPMTEVQVAVTGMLVPSEYASKKHNDAMITKIEVWADDVSVAGLEGSAPSPSQSARPQTSSRPAPARQKKSNSEF